ncbi:MAG: penicillin-binding protein 2 [Micrococcales bacterium]|nr:penicillin-binding protein 2 [Micrococcales bacterium]
MNTPLRRLASVALVMCLVLIGSATWVQFFQSDRLDNDSRNVRTLYRALGDARGPIVVDGVAVASSVPVDDVFGFQRQYSDPVTYSSITGFFGVTGRTGLEQAQNGYLSGSSDQLVFSRLRDVFLGRPPEGAAVETTISPAVQEAALRALGDQEGAIVAIEPSTGRILALVSTPGFDPNELATHDMRAARSAYETLLTAPGNPLRSKAYQERYAPGSTFKLVVAAAALESGRYDASSTLPAPHTYTPPQTSRGIGNFGGGGCGSDPITLDDSLRVSCNTSFAWLGVDLGADALRRQAEAFGFNTEVTIPMLAANSRFPASLDAPQTAQSAIGQFEVQATPLQMAMVSAAIANDGTLMTPYLVDTVRAANLSTVRTTEPKVFARPISASTARTLTEMMENVVRSGSARPVQIPGVAVAAKTGTAQSGQQAPHVWFTGFAPANDPQVAVAVFVKHGGDARHDEATGGRVAAPIARAVIEAVLTS